LQHIDRLGDRSALPGFMNVGQDGDAQPLPDVSPTPRAAEALVRLALSNEDLNTRPMPTLAHISFSAPATSDA
jgi:hypothetical protein